ncbi:MAG TPA: cyclic nucleotide-binding domain-containing protein [Terriglobales bacterium]|nr:cyclic nucleotide-binding domain-containing protein [Terriglobales bacterium]
MAEYEHSGDGVDPSQLLEFIRQSPEKMALPKGSLLFHEGEPCSGAYYVEDGELDLIITSGEKRLKVGSAHAGHLLGVSSVISNSEHQCSAYAAKESKVVFIAAEAMRKYLRQNAEICLYAVQEMGAELLDLSEKAIRPLRLQPRYPKPL